MVWQWLENPYWQVFAGETYLQTKPPIDPSSLTRWRKRRHSFIGATKRIVQGRLSLQPIPLHTSLPVNVAHVPDASSEVCRSLHA